MLDKHLGGMVPWLRFNIRRNYGGDPRVKYIINLTWFRCGFKIELDRPGSNYE